MGDSSSSCPTPMSSPTLNLIWIHLIPIIATPELQLKHKFLMMVQIYKFTNWGYCHQ